MEGTQQLRRQSVLDRAEPSRIRQWRALVIGNRDESRVSELTNDFWEPRQVEPGVHRRQERDAKATEQRQM